ncbi:hypothetical protein ONA91_11640 [Micromonospora sp. DR5-3]|uniref:hypothetical protein n=1 Tax=unclassified Micromonospora TaxID=2617518 RepID=UPI0011D4DBB5|nr:MULTISPECIES: hypothetical protein [unclassified Micromonospora]MCW3815107.1 hypothetical protein [Micromonospora sp. DR5-3]TYC21987.1 hypothetical protein FXF52_22930 [Micromonospora sp. MP36]
MTEWRDASVFFLRTAPPDDERWLRGLSEVIDLRSDGLVFEERERLLHCEWNGLSSRAQLVDGPAGDILVISYFSRDFHSDIAEQPDRWRDFCLLFAGACRALSPTAAVALGTISDDVLTDVRQFAAVAAEEEVTRLRAQPYALLYLGPELQRAAREQDPSWEVVAHELDDGGGITSGWAYDEFPE